MINSKAAPVFAGLSPLCIEEVDSAVPARLLRKIAPLHIRRFLGLPVRQAKLELLKCLVEQATDERVVSLIVRDAIDEEKR